MVYPNIKESLACLDKKRCGKQRIEALQIYKVLLQGPTIVQTINEDGKWENAWGRDILDALKYHPIECVREGKTPWSQHPAVLMWQGFENALAQYYNLTLDEWENRGFKNNMERLEVSLPVIWPDWVGNEEFHASHKSKLLFKGRIDAVCSSLTKHFKKPYSKWNKPYNEYVFPISRVQLPKNKYELKHSHIEALEVACRDLNIKIEINHYSKFGWTEPDNLLYVWPKPKKVSN